MEEMADIVVTLTRWSGLGGAGFQAYKYPVDKVTKQDKVDEKH